MTAYQQAVIALLTIIVFKLYLIHHDALGDERRVDFWAGAAALIGAWIWLGYAIWTVVP